MKRLLLLLTPLLLLAACGTPPDVLVIGAVDKQVSAFPFEFSLQTDLLSLERYQMRYYSSEERLASALADGQVDVAVLPFTHFAGTDASVKLVRSMQRDGGALVSTAETFDDARGYRVGVVNQYMLPMLGALVSDSLRLGWELVEYADRETMTAAWQAGEVQAVADAVPYALGYGEDVTTLLFGDVFRGYPTADVLVHSAALEHKQSLLNDALDAADTAANLINAYPVQAYDSFLKAYPFKRDVIPQTLSHTWYYTTMDTASVAFRTRAAGMLGVSARSLYATP